MKFWQIDAFTDKIFSGNPADVIIVDEFPEKNVMQAIASEMNLSETVFLKALNDQYEIRWFSPRDEAPLCGHATIAAAFILKKLGHVKDSVKFYSHISGELSATFEDDWIWLNFPKLEITQTSAPLYLQEALSGVYIQELYRDNLVYVAVLSSKEEVINLEPNLNLIEQIDCRAVVVTSIGDNNYDFYSRYFAPKVGIPEDPVCGSAHCRLTSYWAKRLGKSEMIAFQASKRGGVLRVQDKGDRTLIAGKAIQVSEGIINWS